ncbi:class I adenylate-forming enzyme family protein [Sphingomonas bacterium]|uniref:class I adenylate-forming enzyme family protein n=1 Tax=Sphingomonas bacterium TaxID=1895847 RepID=UPI0020C6E5D3|nr:class I adenylate-forming enzyme family protein [Sphingomonas bacterium]
MQGRPTRCFIHAPATLGDVWATTRDLGERDYLVFGTERVTYRQAHAITNAVGAWLTARGVSSGDRVAIAMRNYPEWMLIYWACMSIGAVVVGLNAWWVSGELAGALDDAGPKAIFCDAERLARIADWRTAHRDCIVVVRADAPPDTTPWSHVIATNDMPVPVAIDGDADACIFYTSGTTGQSKGARLSHRGCTNNLMGIGFGVEVHRLAAGRGLQASAETLPVALVTTPLFHVTANNCLAHPVTAAGGTLVLMYKWDAGEALRLIEAERVTTMSGVPIMVRELIGHPDARARDLSSLASLAGGGAPIPPDLVAKVDDWDRAVGLGTGFGMTEASGSITLIAGNVFAARPESCGRPLPTFDVKIINDAGQKLASGRTGELCVRGAGVIAGYLNRPVETAAAIVDGWLRTGDIARLDEQGFVFIVDRKKDMILRGGENVYCAEVEAALFRHPDVIEVCAFSVPDTRLGEEVGVAVVLRPGSLTTADALRAHAVEFLARYKTPRYLWRMDGPLPRNAGGKLLRPALRASLRLADAS